MLRGGPALVCVAAALLTACDCAAPIDRSPAARPPGWLAIVSVRDEVSLGDLQARLPTGLARAMVPGTLRGAAEILVRLPDWAQPGPGSPLRCLALRDGDQARWVCAFRAGTLASEVSSTGTGPRGARWLEAAPAAALHADGVLVVGDGREAVQTAFAHLAFTALDAPARAAVEIELASDVPGTVLRPVLEGLVDEAASSLRRSASEARRAHADAPALGEPEALVDALAVALRRELAFLPDLGASSITLEAPPGALAVALEAEVLEGSPLDRRLDAIPAGPPLGLAALAPEIAIALSRRSGVEARAAWAADTVAWLAPLAGGRLPDADRTVLEAELSAWQAGSGEASLFGLGVCGSGPFALVASDAGSGDPPARALAVPWVAALLGRILGCPDATPCARAVAVPAHPAFLLEGSADCATDASRLLSAGAADPDLERAVGALGTDTLLALAVRPALLPALLRPSSGGELRAAAVLAVSRSERRLRVRFIAPTGALSDAAAVAELVSGS